MTSVLVAYLRPSSRSVVERSMIALIPLVAAIVGLLIYVLVTTNTKVAELGRLLYFAGILAWLFSVAHQVTVLLK